MTGRDNEHSSPRAALSIALTAILLLGPRISFGQAGSLDATFGTGGLVTTDFASFADVAESVALQADGKIIAAGYAINPLSGNTDDFALTRYDSDGTLDLTFGTGGRVTTDFGGSTDWGLSVTLQPDGKIIVAGAVSDPSSHFAVSSFALARYSPDGSLDPTFGTAGRVTTTFVGDHASALSVALQPDGKIVAAGVTSDRSGVTLENFALVRYNTDGSLDPDFGVGGRVTTDFAGDADEARSVVLQPDGKIVAAGYADVTSGRSVHAFALARYNPTGSLDASFGVQGLVTTFFAGEQEEIFSVALQPDGKIVAAGLTDNSSFGGTEDFALVRYNTDGSLDPDFGVGGRVTTDFAPGFTSPFAAGADRIKSVILQADNKIIAAGSFWNPNSGTVDFALARYTPDGSLDATFGTEGLVITDFGESADRGRSAALQTDGKIVVAGLSGVLGSPTGSNFALARYIGDAAPSQTISSIIEDVQDLVISGALNIGQGRALEATLESADKQIDSGNTSTASKQLKAFIWSVAALIRGGILTASEGQPLIDAAQSIIDDFQEPSGRIAGGAEALEFLVLDGRTLPGAFNLAQNYPNPFNPTTEIRFVVPDEGHVELVVYDIMGREVARLFDGSLPAGTYALPWNAENVPSGAYAYRLTSGNLTASKTMLLLK